MTEKFVEKFEQKFLGKILFFWEGWDDIEAGLLQFYNVDFPFESMKKYDGLDVCFSLDGYLEIYDENDQVAWEGFPTDIKEWK